MSKCVACTSFNLKEIPEMARLGFGWCPKQNPTYESGVTSREKTVSASMDACEQFEAAPALTTSNRIEWIARQKVLK